MKKKMTRWLVLSLLVFMFVGLIGCAQPQPAQPSDTKEPEKVDEQTEEPKKTVDLEGTIISIASLSPGGLNHTIAEAFAAAITKNTPMTARVEPSSGPSAWFGALERGEVEFGIAGDYDAWAGYLGDSDAFERAFPKLRTVKQGADIMKGTLIVAGDSPFYTMDDLIGKRIAGNLPAHPFQTLSVYYFLAGSSIDINQVQIVPVESYADGLRAVVEGRADATTGIVGTAAVEELAAAKGARYIPLDISEAGLKRAREFFPMLGGTVLQPGAVGINEPTSFYTWSFTLITASDIPDEIVHEVTRVLVEEFDSFKEAHPAMNAFVPANSVSEKIPVPVHEASIEYYKSVNLWDQSTENAHNNLLKE